MNAGTGANLVGQLPVGTVNGDLLIACVFINHASATPGISGAPVGWQLVDSQLYGPNALPTGIMAVYWKIAASEPSTWTWTGANAGGGYNFIVEVAAVSDASDWVTPFDDQKLATSSGTGTNIIGAGVTTTRPSDLLLGFFGVHSNTVIAPDPSMTEVQDKGNPSGTLETAWSVYPAIGLTPNMVAVSSSTDWTTAWLGAIKATPQPPAGAPAVRSISSTPVVATTSLIGTLPAGTVNGDALYACIFTASTSSNPGITGVPAGWTLLDTTTVTNGRMSVYWKVAASEPSTWTWTAGGNSNGVIQVVAVMNPGNPTTPTDVSALQVNTAGLAIVAPSITPTSVNSLVLGFFGARATAVTSLTPDANMFELWDQGQGLATLEACWETRPSFGVATGTRTSVPAATSTGIGWLGAVYGSSPSPRTGTLTATLGNVTVASAAGAVAGGTLSRTLANVTVAGSATAVASASLSRTLDAVTLASAMQVGRVGLLTQTLENLTVASAVNAIAGASLSRTLADVTTVSAVQVIANGQLTRTLDATTLSGHAGLVAKATLAATLGNVSVSSAAGVSANATADNVLAPAVLDSAATLVANCTLTQALENITFDAFASFPPVIGLSLVLEDLTLTGAGSIKANAFVNQFLDNVTLAGVAATPVVASLSRALDPTSLTGFAAQVNHVGLTQTLLDATLVGIGSAYTPSSARTGLMYSLLDPVVSTTASTAGITGRMNQTLDDITITDVISVLTNVVGILSLNPAQLLGIVSAPSIGRLDVTLNDSLLFSDATTPITNGLAVTLANVTVVGTGVAPATGRCTATLGNLGATFQARVPVIARCVAILDDVGFVSSSNAYTLAYADIMLGDVRLDSQVIAAGVARGDWLLEDVALEGNIVIPAIAALTAALEALVGSGVATAVATGRTTTTLQNVGGDLQAQAPATIVAVPVLEGLTLAAEAGAIIAGTHTTLLDDVVLDASAFATVSVTLDQIFDDMQFVGYMLHVVRTPVLSVSVQPGYIYAQVSTTEIHVEVETTFIEAMLTKEYQDKAA
jgi:hypothetical protein